MTALALAGIIVLLWLVTWYFSHDGPFARRNRPKLTRPELREDVKEEPVVEPVLIIEKPVERPVEKPVEKPVVIPVIEVERPVPVMKPKQKLETVPGAALALKNPPGTLDEIIKIITADYQIASPGKRPMYAVPLVWTARGNEMLLHWCRLTALDTQPQGEVNHMTIAGLKNTGKDSIILMIAVVLAKMHSPEELGFYVIDGKGDLILLKLLQHTVMCATEEDTILSAFEAVEKERDRRQQIINNQSLNDRYMHKWETLPETVKRENNMTQLLCVFISEIALLQSRFSSETEFNKRMTPFILACRSAGIRVFLSTQNFSGKDVEWRGQVDLKLSSAQSQWSDVRPNLGIESKQIEERGAVPPHKLNPTEHKGVFTVTHAGDAVTGRASWLSPEETQKAFNTLPLRVPNDPAITPPVEEKKERSREEKIQEAMEFLRNNRGMSTSAVATKLFGVAGGNDWSIVRAAEQRLTAEQESDKKEIPNEEQD